MKVIQNRFNTLCSSTLHLLILLSVANGMKRRVRGHALDPNLTPKRIHEKLSGHANRILKRFDDAYDNAASDLVSDDGTDGVKSVETAIQKLDKLKDKVFSKVKNMRSEVIVLDNNATRTYNEALQEATNKQWTTVNDANIALRQAETRHTVAAGEVERLTKLLVAAEKRLEEARRVQTAADCIDDVTREAKKKYDEEKKSADAKRDETNNKVEGMNTEIGLWNAKYKLFDEASIIANLVRKNWDGVVQLEGIITKYQERNHCSFDLKVEFRTALTNIVEPEISRSTDEHENDQNRYEFIEKINDNWIGFMLSAMRTEEGDCTKFSPEQARDALNTLVGDFEWRTHDIKVSKVENHFIKDPEHIENFKKCLEVVNVAKEQNFNQMKPITINAVDKIVKSYYDLESFLYGMDMLVYWKNKVGSGNRARIFRKHDAHKKGNLCRVAMQRPQSWCFAPLPRFDETQIVSNRK